MEFKETIIGNNKFVWDGNELRIYEIDFPVNEISISKDELKEILEFNKMIAEVTDAHSI